MRKIRDIVSISGFGGRYENACQEMLQAGYEWLENNQEKIEKLEAHEYSNVLGLFVSDSPEAKEFEDAVTEGQKDVTGAMVHVTMGHLYWIAKHGVNEWIAEAIKRDQLLKNV